MHTRAAPIPKTTKLRRVRKIFRGDENHRPQFKNNQKTPLSPSGYGQ